MAQLPTIASAPVIAAIIAILLNFIDHIPPSGLRSLAVSHSTMAHAVRHSGFTSLSAESKALPKLMAAL
jgi:hypothetical protein